MSATTNIHACKALSYAFDDAYDLADDYARDEGYRLKGQAFEEVVTGFLVAHLAEQILSVADDAETREAANEYEQFAEMVAERRAAKIY